MADFDNEGVDVDPPKPELVARASWISQVPGMQDIPKSTPPESSQATVRGGAADDVPVAPSSVPAAGGDYSGGSFWVTGVPEHIAIRSLPGCPKLTPTEVQTALELYLAFRGRNPQFPAERIHKIIEAVVERLAAADGAPALTVDVFQDACNQTAIYPRAGDCLIYPLLGLIDELGEALEVVGKTIYAAEFDATMTLVADLLSCAIQLGKVAGLVKKAYRNHDGVLSEAALDTAITAAEKLDEHHGGLNESLERWDSDGNTVAFPALRLTQREKEKFAAELGDLGWYWNVTLAEVRLRADGVARALLAKLSNRAAKGTLASTGDDEATRPVGGG